jgi:hypothetical protein
MGHERRFRDLLGTSAYPPRLAVKADIPDRQVRAINGRKQAQHMLCDDLVGRARSTWCTITPSGDPTPSCADIQMTQQIIAMASPRTERVCDGRSGGFALAVDAVLQQYRPALD